MTLEPSTDNWNTSESDRDEGDSISFCKRLVLLGRLRKVGSKYLVSTSSVVSLKNRLCPFPPPLEWYLDFHHKNNKVFCRLEFL